MAGKKRGLGRGLDALLGPTPVVATVDDAAKNAGVNDVPRDQETLRLIPVEWIQAVVFNQDTNSMSRNLKNSRPPFVCMALCNPF